MTFNCVPLTVVSVKLEFEHCSATRYYLFIILSDILGKLTIHSNKMYSFHFHVSLAMERIYFDIVFFVVLTKGGNGVCLYFTKKFLPKYINGCTFQVFYSNWIWSCKSNVQDSFKRWKNYLQIGNCKILRKIVKQSIIK